MESNPASSYDELPYEDLAFYHTHPSNLAVVATLCGLAPPPVDNCSVLELGCGSGFNLLAMSQSLPQARLVGVDLSQCQIESGRALAAQIGAANVELHVGDAAALDDSLGCFDYVIAHGLVSWVSTGVREAILRTCRRHLQPAGIAYLSYNTYPGWHLRGILRDALLFHAAHEGTPLQRVRHARAALARMLDDLPEPDSDHAKFLRRQIEALSDDGDAYVFHEFLEAENQPLNFAEFAALTAANGLRYVGEARHGTSAAAQTGALRAALDTVGPDPLRQEQYHDLLRNRSFRQSLLCHAERQPAATLDRRALDSLFAISQAERLAPEAGEPTSYRLHGDTVIRIVDPLFRAVLDSLAESWPQALPVGQLIEAAGRLVDRERLPPGMPVDLLLPDALVQGYALGYWHLYAHEPPAVLVGGQRPHAAALARHCAQGGASVTNLLHRPVELDARQREVLVCLDGGSSVDEIAQALAVTPESVAEAVLALAQSWLLVG